MTTVFTVNAFTKNGKGGNPAGIVADEKTRTAEEKQKIAKIAGYSETVFLSKGTDTDFVLEYFTPEGEVPLCGHATIALFSFLYSRKKIAAGEYTFLAKAGMMRVFVQEDGRVFMEQNLPDYGEVLQKEELSCCIDAEMIAEDLPVQIVSTGLRDILLPVKNRTALDEMHPDFPALSQLSKERNAVGVHAFTLDPETGTDAVCRNFAPLYGINEESATGTSSCALACLLFKEGRKQKEYVFEQGYSLFSPSRIIVRLTFEEERITEIFVGGYGQEMNKRKVEI